MTNRTQIILSQLTPPAQRGNVLSRSRVNTLLAESLKCPLTILVAGTGYGKTTSLLTFINALHVPVSWYSVTAAERDPTLFLTNLFSAFNRRSPRLGQAALRLLENGEVRLLNALNAFTNTLIERLNSPALLVIDDFQKIGDSDEIVLLMDWFIEHLPPHLHVIIASRVPPEFPSINRWRAMGIIVEIDKTALAFSEAEVLNLFRDSYQVDLSLEDVEQLVAKTEGWAIGLQVVWQSIRAVPEQTIRGILYEGKPQSLVNLFAYLAEEVLDKQATDRRDFLLKTAILQLLDSDSCDFLLDSSNSLDHLNDLYRSGLFVEQLQPGVYRYHHIFREFLLSRLNRSPDLARELHLSMASYFIAHQYWPQAISHLLSAREYPRVQTILEDIGEHFLQSGLHQSISYWLSQLPADLLENFAYGNYLKGELFRNDAAFDQALESYRAAQRLYTQRQNNWGTSLALRGQAQVYLDTLRPSSATQLLSRALELINPGESPHETAGLLTQLAENQVNQGYIKEASENLHRARSLSGTDQEVQDFIEARLLLRTGNHQDGIRLLETLETDPVKLEQDRPQRFHREASLLLSLFYSLKGNAGQARQYAEKGKQVSAQLHSTLVESIGNMRLGHALQLDPILALDPQHVQKVQALYEQAIRGVDIVRLHVEPLWGMVRLAGYAGKIDEARAIANEALAIARNAGDEWIGMLLRISLGASLAMVGDYEKASQELALAETSAEKVGDQLARTAALVWQAYTADQQGFKNSTILFLDQAFQLISKHGYEFLLTHPTLLGPNDIAAFAPMLIKAGAYNLQPGLAQPPLNKPAAQGARYHPGYTLRLSLLGPFETYIGVRRVTNDAWKREKARQLLQILAARSNKGATREQIGLFLWPEADASTATNNLKVNLNALNQVLEPNRPSGEAARFVIRREDHYLLNPEMPIRNDHEEFERLAASPRLEDAQQALCLYRGRFLEGEVIQEHFMVEGQYFHRLYLGCLARVIEAALQAGDYERALQLSDRMIQQDPQFEAGYEFQMRAYHALGNQSLVRKVCQQALDIFEKTYGEGAAPRELTALLERLTG